MNTPFPNTTASPDLSAARADKLADLRRRLPKVSETSLKTIVEIALPAVATKYTADGRPEPEGIKALMARQEARRAAVSEVLTRIGEEFPGRPYDAVFSIARSRVPELFGA